MKKEELFEEWFIDCKKINPISHQKNFVYDGIVNEKEWNSKDNLKIMFLLKEAYFKEGFTENTYDLTKDLSRLKPWGMWYKVSHWVYGLNNTTINRIEPFSTEFSYPKCNTYLNSIAVVNIKKSNGKSKSDNEEIMKYATLDGPKLIKQIEYINPDIIICGKTFDALCNIFVEAPLKVTNEKPYLFYDLFGKEVLIIDYYHPAGRYPNILYYYGILNIYQQALIEKRNR